MTNHIQSNEIKLEGGTYEVIQKRLNNHASELRNRLLQLNENRKQVFGSVDLQLLANDRITTDNNCIPRDMVAIGDRFIFGYNVHIGLRTEVKLNDVFSVYRFEGSDHSFHQEEEMTLLADETFHEEFLALYKYYKGTTFSRFAVIGPHLYMVFRIGKGLSDIKTFKWAIGEHHLTYLGNRFDHEFRQPEQHEFVWKRTTREMQRRGEYPHISIEDRVFVETIGGDLTVKVEDNTDSGQGIYSEPVDNPDQTLDDADYYYADLGNIIILKIRPYQEKAWRFLIFNEKMQEVIRVDSVERACVKLPDDQGIIFSNGYYLQTGEYKLFDNASHDLNFEKKLASSNGEDFLYTFYNEEEGIYVLLHYNLVEQKVDTPLTCHGYSIFPDGELCYFRAEEDPGRHHVVKVWQTPYATTPMTGTGENSSYLFKVGNKDLVRGMAVCNELLTLLGKGDMYGDLYTDLVKKSNDILDGFYWINHADTRRLDQPLREIREAAGAAIDEFEKVKKVRQHTQNSVRVAKAEVQALFDRIRRYKPKQTDQFVGYLSSLRKLRGEIISLKELRYIDVAEVEAMEAEVEEKADTLAAECVEFLLTDDALQPYMEKVAEAGEGIKGVSKVTEADEVAGQIDQIAHELELLIDIVSNLNIEDATQTTAIIDNISGIYAGLNQLRAELKRTRKELSGTEARAEFLAQIKLLNQGLINYIDLCDTPEKCEEYLTRMMIQVEELEGKFTEYEEFLPEIGEKREEIYQAFETRKVSLLEKRNRRASAIMSAAERILKGIDNRLDRFTEVSEINAYFAADLMVQKVRDMIDELEGLKDSVKAGDLQARLKTLREDAIRQQKDRNDLYVNGVDTLRLGRHAFAVNVQNLDLTMVPREGEMFFHLTGTNFFEQVRDTEFLTTRPVWDQSLISENRDVYRGEYLAFQVLHDLIGKGRNALEDFVSLSEKAAADQVRDFMTPRFEEGYVKGVHDHDATILVKKLVEVYLEAGLLRYSPRARACASVFWHDLKQEDRNILNRRLKGAGVILKAFPDVREFGPMIRDIQEHIRDFAGVSGLFSEEIADEAGEYLFYELAENDTFIISGDAVGWVEDFQAFLKQKRLVTGFKKSWDELKGETVDALEMIRAWLGTFMSQAESKRSEMFLDEAAAILLRGATELSSVKKISLIHELKGLSGEHAVIDNGLYQLNYNEFMSRMKGYEHKTVPMYRKFSQLKKELIAGFREELRLEEFRPRVMASFVRNRLIDKLYLPIIGDNLAKQMGTVGEETRTDRMGMLLLISPPGYGKTTLMEYVAHRLGLIFMKVNGPAIGHHVTSLDPQEAPNAAAREELMRLNLALEMGDNIMLYMDDIQHLNPEFLQKFISLCDAQRKIEGVYKGRTRTYDLRGKKVAVVMAGNPYTESGEKFRIPDMLANRADTYNLGDIIGDNADLFKLSYIENALTSNEVLARIASRPQEDLYALVRLAETDEREGVEFTSSITEEEISEAVSVLKKLFVIRDVVLKVNRNYILSAGQEDAYRTEPPFLLQGSYRNMNKLAEKVSPIMNGEELTTLILAHYEGEAQTLTRGAEANLLKFRALTGYASEQDESRWKEILEIYLEGKRLNADRMAQLIDEMSRFAKGLEHIREVLERGIK